MERWHHRGIVLCGLLVLSQPVLCATKAFFTSKESVEEEMSRLIEKSRSSIDMALFELKSPRLVGALKRAIARGIHVRLLLDTSHRAEDLAAGEVRWIGGKNIRGRGVMHHKFVLFDKEKVITGSFNWTPGAEYANYENALVIDDSKTVDAFREEFETLWRRALEGPPPNGSSGQKKPEKKHHSPRLRQKYIKIRVSKPVIKRRRKAHTNTL